MAPRDERHPYTRCAAMALVLSIPNLLVWALVYPGFLQADHQNTIGAMATGTFDEWHSLLWGFFAYPFIYLSPSYSLYGLVQLSVFVVSVMYCLEKLQRLRLITARAAWWLTVIMAISPTYLMYSMLYSSDVVFSVLLMPLTMMLIEIYHTQGQVLTRISFDVGLCLLLYTVTELRKNALLIVIFLFVILQIVFRHYWKQTGLSLLCCVILIGSTTLFNNVILHSVKSPSQEYLSVPVQQIGRAVKDDGFIPENAVQVLQRIRPLAEWGQDYTPANADPLKFNNKHRDMEKVSLSIDFIKAWIAIGLHNPVSYIRAYADLMHPYWQITANPSTRYIRTDFSNHDEFTTHTCKQQCRPEYLAQFKGNHSAMQKRVASLVDSISNAHIPVVTDAINLVFFNRSLPLWVFLIGLIMMLRKKSALGYVMISTPVWSILISLLAFSPVASFRYALQMYYALPLLITWLIAASSHSGIAEAASSQAVSSQIKH